MDKVTFIGPWDSEEKHQIQALLQAVVSDYPSITIECSYRTTGIPYKAKVDYRGLYFDPVAYGPNILVENIKNGLPVQYSR